MATAREQGRERRAISQALGSGKREGFLTLLVQETTGPDPVRLELRRGLLPTVGAEWPTEQRGESYSPIGASSAGFSSVLGLAWGDTEMTLHLDAAFLRETDLVVDGPLDVDRKPESIHQAFVALQTRGRACLVQLGKLVRVGVLRRVSAKPGRGYSVSPSGGQYAYGANIELALKWEWHGDGAGIIPTPKVRTGDMVAGQLGLASLAAAKGLGDIDALRPDFVEQLGDKIGALRKGIADLRRAAQKVGSFVTAPVRLVNEAVAAARSLGNVVSDVRNLVSGTEEALFAANRNASTLLRAKGALGNVRQATYDCAEAIVGVLDAVEQRKARRVRVRPGQSLVEIAARELGDGARWPEVARHNDIAGQMVPRGTYAVELPPGGG